VTFDRGFLSPLWWHKDSTAAIVLVHASFPKLSLDRVHPLSEIFTIAAAPHHVNCEMCEQSHGPHRPSFPRREMGQCESPPSFFPRASCCQNSPPPPATNSSASGRTTARSSRLMSHFNRPTLKLSPNVQQKPLLVSSSGVQPIISY
jgi:hypothetical protein